MGWKTINGRLRRPRSMARMKMWPMRFRIKTIMAVIALVGVSLGIGNAVAVVAKNRAYFVLSLIQFWLTVFIILAQSRRKPVDNEIGEHTGGEAERV